MVDILYVVEPAPEERARIAEALSGENADIQTFASAEQLIEALAAPVCGCVLVPVDLPGIGASGLIAEIRRRQLGLAVVVIGREDDLRVAVNMVRAGATDFIEHPASITGYDPRFAAPLLRRVRQVRMPADATCCPVVDTCPDR